MDGAELKEYFSYRIKNHEKKLIISLKRESNTFRKLSISFTFTLRGTGINNN